MFLRKLLTLNGKSTPRLGLYPLPIDIAVGHQQCRVVKLKQSETINI